jgi:M6 family metalloprotease-like protein
MRNRTTTFKSITMRTILVIAVLILIAFDVTAVAPTKEAIEKWQREGVWDRIVENWKTFKLAGVCSPSSHSPFSKEKLKQNLALGRQPLIAANLVVILVDFSDKPYTNGPAGSVAAFDSILFSNAATDTIFNPTGSMTEYYLENSYGQFQVEGDIYGWFRMPKTYSYYVDTTFGIGKSREFAADAINLANNVGGVDFSQHDADSDGYCDGVIIIHAGKGAEEGGNDIWSHQWNLYPAQLYDGVWVYDYTVNPEESGTSLASIGVFCHEYGHVLGLPDLYDVSNSLRSGLGDWSLMATGNWNMGGKKPAHLDSWCKNKVGFLDLIEVSSNIYQQSIPAIEFNPVAFKLQNSASGNQYWIIENRQKIGFDIQVPGQGLCIYHVDPAGGPYNSNPLQYLVAMEQADGRNDLAKSIKNRGDAGDPWQAPYYTEFHNLSNPDSRTNVDSLVTKIGVWRISTSDSIMSADLDIEYSRPWIELSGSAPLQFFDDPPEGDGDGVLEAGETIRFYCTIINKMRRSYNVHATLSTANPSVSFVTNNVPFNTDLLDTAVSNVASPIIFDLADTLVSSIDSFYLTITTDSLPGIPGSGTYTKTFGFEVYLGAPQVLLVDDDRGDDYEVRYQDAFSRLQIPIDTWHKNISGSPTGGDLMNYQVVFWHTGDSTSGALNSNDIAAMKEFLDNGRNLFLTTASGVLDINSLDPAFLTEYFHATYVGNDKWVIYEGVTGNVIGDSTNYMKTGSWDPYFSQQLLAPVDGGEAAFILKADPAKICGVTYSGAHKSILLTFSAEFINDAFAQGNPGYYPKDTLIARSMKFFGKVLTSVYDGQPFGQPPRNFELHQNYPNPFNPITNISYTLRATGRFGDHPPRTNLSIYNILGQRVKTLVDQVQIPGTYVMTWDGTNSFGRPVASGVYFYRLVRGDDSQTKKMVLVR